MSFKLSTSERDERAFLVEKLSDSAQQFDLVVASFNETMRAAWLKVAEAQAVYNAVIEEADAFIDRIHSAHHQYFESKPEKWQESEAGEKATVWLEEWETSLDLLDLEPPDDIEATDAHDNRENFAALPEEA